MTNLPPPANTEQMYLAEILSELQALNELLTASIMPAVGGGLADPDLVQLREPKRRAPKRGSLPRRPPTDEFDQELDG